MDMRYYGRNANANVPASFDVRNIVRFALLAWVMLIIPFRLHGGETPFAHIGDDLSVASHVRAAMRKDAQLRSHLPLVIVTNGIVHLSGPLPSAELKKRAVAVAKRVAGVLKVESGELYLADSLRHVRPLPLPLENDEPTRSRSASPSTLSSVRDVWPAPDTAPPPASPVRIALMAPEAVASPSRPMEPARLTAHPHAVAPVVSLSARLEHLRRSDVRFRAIRTEIEGTTVYILSGRTSGEHVMAFARGVRRLPGVQHVIIRGVSPQSR